MNVFELFAKIGLDTKEYESGLANAQSKAEGFGSKVGSAAKVGAAAVAAVGTAVIGAGTAFTKQAGQVAEYGDHIDKMSQKIGISAEAYQEWDAIMQHSGASVDSLRPAMKTLSTQAQKGNEAFQKLGISEKEVASLSSEDLFAKVVSGLQGMEQGTERTYIASQLLGRGATELGALLNTSAEDTEKMRQKVHELGGVMSDEAVKAAARYEDSLQDMQTAMQGLKRNFMSDFLPGFADVMDGLADVFTGGTDKGLETISQGIDSIVGKFSEKLPQVLEVASGIIEALLMAIVENLPKIFDTGTDVVMNLVDGLLSNLPKILDAGMKAITALAEGIAKALPKLIPSAVKAILQIVRTLLDNLPKILDAALKIIKGLAQGLLKALPELIKELPKIIKGITKFLIDSIPQIIQAGIELLTSLIEELPTIIDAIVESLPDIIDGIVTGLLSPTNLEKMIEAGVQLFVAIVSNIPKIIVGIVKAIPKIIEGIINGFMSLIENFVTVGKEIVNGIIKGIRNSLPELLDHLGLVGQLIASALRNKLKIKSPSKVTEYFGDMLMKGLEVGVDRSSKDVYKSVDRVSDGIYDALNQDYEFGVSGRMNNITSSRNASVSAQNGYTDDLGTYEEEIIVPQGGADSTRNLTVILELDRMQLGRAVYRLNNEETQRVGVQLAGVNA